VLKAARSKGKAREVDIIVAAQTVLANEGYEQFTLRNVADKVGMRLSHLQYYFATKGDLVRALLAHVAQEYAQKTAEVLAQVPDTPTARFMAWIDYLLHDCWDPRTRHFFVQLWGLAESEDASSGELLAGFLRHRHHRDPAAARGAESAPRQPPARPARYHHRGRHRGMMLMVGSGPRAADERRELLTETRKQIFRIATEA
jgi:AcrR family transcriptional regulator